MNIKESVQKRAGGHPLATLADRGKNHTYKSNHCISWHPICWTQFVGIEQFADPITDNDPPGTNRGFKVKTYLENGGTRN